MAAHLSTNADLLLQFGELLLVHYRFLHLKCQQYLLMFNQDVFTAH